MHRCRTDTCQNERHAAWERFGATENERHCSGSAPAKRETSATAARAVRENAKRAPLQRERSAKTQNERHAAWERFFGVQIGQRARRTDGRTDVVGGNTGWRTAAPGNASRKKIRRSGPPPHSDNGLGCFREAFFWGPIWTIQTAKVFPCSVALVFFPPERSHAARRSFCNS